MKRILIALSILLSVTCCARLSIQADSEDLPLCPHGTMIGEDSAIESGCILDPSDCSRGIDESNQSECEAENDA